MGYVESAAGLGRDMRTKLATQQQGLMAPLLGLARTSCLVTQWASLRP